MPQTRTLALAAALLSYLACYPPQGPRLPPEWEAALAGREMVELEGVVYLPTERLEPDEPDPVELRLARLGEGSALYSFAWPEPPPPEDDGERIPIQGHLSYLVVEAQGSSDREPATIFELGELAISHIADLETPSIVKLGGVEAAKAKDPASPPELDFAIAGLEVSGFDVYAPPEIKVFDHDSGELVHRVEFRAEIYTQGKPLVHKPRNLLVPVLLAFDADPWAHTPSAPTARRSRIELHFLGKKVETVFARLAAGIWVVPVVWHNVGEEQSRSLVDDQDVRDIFWTPVDKNTGADINWIFRQAQVQFRLVEIRDHLVPRDKSASNRCAVEWSSPLSSPEGVDIYAVDDLYQQPHPGAPKSPITGGFGGCHDRGHLLISEPHFAKTWIAGQAWLVAHELGHYVGASVSLTDLNNLMYHPVGTGTALTTAQKKEIHDRLAALRYNEQK